ncbi:hypothetical protein B0H13DRAFT_1716598, partial [Mycena leptocephala]
LPAPRTHSTSTHTRSPHTHTLALPARTHARTYTRTLLLLLHIAHTLLCDAIQLHFLLPRDDSPSHHALPPAFFSHTVWIHSWDFARIFGFLVYR